MSDASLPVGPRRPMRSLGIAASGLSAQRARLDAIASNIANVETTRGVGGTPYRRRVVQLQEIGFQPLMEGSIGGPGEDGFGGVRVSVVEDASPGPMIYDPGHPDADNDGYVQMPNVNLTDEMVDLMHTRRLFEANATVFNAIKSMLHRATQL